MKVVYEHPEAYYQVIEVGGKFRVTGTRYPKEGYGCWDNAESAIHYLDMIIGEERFANELLIHGDGGHA